MRILQTAAEPPRLEAYLSYIDYEMTHDDPARIQNIFERALQENCLNSELWLKYAKYLVSSKFSFKREGKSYPELWTCFLSYIILCTCFTLFHFILFLEGSQETTGWDFSLRNVREICQKLSVVFPVVAEICSGYGEISQTSERNQR